MNISSKTPEGSPNQCPICNQKIVIEVSSFPTHDAPCPKCGHLLSFTGESKNQITILPYNPLKKREKNAKPLSQLIWGFLPKPHQTKKDLLSKVKKKRRQKKNESVQKFSEEEIARLSKQSNRFVSNVNMFLLVFHFGTPFILSCMAHYTFHSFTLSLTILGIAFCFTFLKIFDPQPTLEKLINKETDLPSKDNSPSKQPPPCL